MRMNFRQKVSANNFQCTENSFHIDVLPSSLLGPFRMFTECLKRRSLSGKQTHQKGYVYLHICKCNRVCLDSLEFQHSLLLWRSFSGHEGPPRWLHLILPFVIIVVKPVTLDIGSFTLKLRGISFYCSSIQTWAIIGTDLLRILNCDFAFCRQNQ